MKLADLPVREVRKLKARDPIERDSDETSTQTKSIAKLNAELRQSVVVGEFVIEKNIPMPDSLRGGPSKKYPFHLMTVGDSFASQFASENAAKLGQKSLCATARTWAKRNDPSWRFVTRVNGCEVRIWRVK